MLVSLDHQQCIMVTNLHTQY